MIPEIIRDILPDALADCGAGIPDSDAAAAGLAFTHLARLHVGRQASERWILDMVCMIARRSGYADGVICFPLGSIFDLDDEWNYGWGRSEPELVQEISGACAAQLAAGSL
jgi:hypothetical protein